MSDSDRVFGMFGSNSMIETHSANGDETGNQIFGAAKTPQYVIHGENIFRSCILGYEQFAPCLWYETGTARLATYDSTDAYTADGRIVAKTTTVCMKYGQWGPPLLNHLTTGDAVNVITIKRLNMIVGELVELQSTSFYHSTLTKYEQRGDKIFFAFSFDLMTDETCMYNNEGRKLGVSGFEFNYTTLYSASGGEVGRYVKDAGSNTGLNSSGDEEESLGTGQGSK